MQDGKPKDIKECLSTSYGVKFPLLCGTIAENMCMQTTGKRQEPVYKWLRDNSELKGGDMQWNFEKFLINGNGEIIKYYQTPVEPNAIKADIEALLAWSISNMRQDTWLK